MLTWCTVCPHVQYAFLVTSVVQFAGGVVVFFGLLTSPKEVGKDSRNMLEKLVLVFEMHQGASQTNNVMKS